MPCVCAPGSMLFQFDDQQVCQTDTVPCVDQHNFGVVERLLSLCRPSGFGLKLLRDVRRLKRQLLQEDDRLDVVTLGALLAEIGYAVSVRCALGGAQPAGAAALPGNCFRNLRHEFLFVRCEAGDYAGCEFLVDPCFRDQFAIPQPTAAYRQLLASVPEEFVGTSMRLQPVVELLCAEMCASFESRGLTTPPWRRPAAMLSKFFPKAVKDIAMGRSSCNSPANGAVQAACARPTAAAAAAAQDNAAQQQQQQQQQAWPACTSPGKRLKEAAWQLAHLWQAGYHNQGSPTYESDTSPPPGAGLVTLASVPAMPAAPTAQPPQHAAATAHAAAPRKATASARPAARACTFAGQEQAITSSTVQPQQGSTQLTTRASSPQPLLPVTSLLAPAALGPEPQQLSVRLSEPQPPQLQRRSSCAVSLLSVQLAGNSNPTSPTASAAAVAAGASHKAAPMCLPSQTLGGVVPQQQGTEQATPQKPVPAAAVVPAAPAHAPGVGAAHPAAPGLIFVPPELHAGAAACKRASQASRITAAAAQACKALAASPQAGPNHAPAADTVHISWCGGVIHKVKPRGMHQQQLRA